MTSTISGKLRVLALVVAMMMAMTCLNMFGAAAAADAAVLTLEEIEEISLLEAPATTANEDILKAWENDNGEVILPATFGGCYITDDYKLAVKLVQGNPMLRTEIENAVEDPSVLRFVTTTISLNGLLEIQGNLSELLPYADVLGSGISVANGQVNVTLPPDTQVRARVDNPYVNIAYGGAGTLHAEVTHNPGEMISYNNSGILTEGGTLGWYGYYNFAYDGEETGEELCFVTAGHVVYDLNYKNEDMLFDGLPVFDEDYYDDRLSCIYVYGSRYSGTATLGDYGILRCGTTSHTVNESFYLKRTATATTTIEASLGTSSSASGNLNLIEGKTVYKAYGKGGYNPGRVTAINCQATGFITPTDYATRYVSGLVQVTSNTQNAFSVGGDSGAPVFFKDGGLTPTLVGFVAGGAGEQNPLVSYITPITILRDIGFEPYLPSA